MKNLEEQFARAKPGDFGIIGDPVEHSLSPKFQNRALKDLWEKQQKNAALAPVYHKFWVRPDQLKEAFDLIRLKQLRGINVTVPHKSAVQGYLDKIDPFAEKVRSVNTVINENGKLQGFNTDAEGFVQAVKEDLNFNLKGKTVLVLGIGGTGSVLIQKMLDENVRQVYYWNRTAEKELDIVDSKLFRLSSPEDISNEMSGIDLVVNATSVGLKENDPSPLPSLSFHAKQFVYDVVYHRETEFLKQARAAGAKVSGGLGMLLHQGAKSFEIWTGAKAPLELMRKGLK